MSDSREERERVNAENIDLMLRVKGGDKGAFTQLVKRHQKMLLNFFIQSGVRYDCEDLVQRTFLRLYRYRDRYTPSAKFTTFLFLLARQEWIDEIRRRDRQKRLRETLSSDPVALPVFDEAEGVGARAVRLDLEQALASLSDGLRQVVVLGVYQQLPYAEISEILGIPVGTVKSRMFNALAKLRSYMEGL